MFFSSSARIRHARLFLSPSPFYVTTVPVAANRFLLVFGASDITQQCRRQEKCNADRARSVDLPEITFVIIRKNFSVTGDNDLFTCRNETGNRTRGWCKYLNVVLSTYLELFLSNCFYLARVGKKNNGFDARFLTSCLLYIFWLLIFLMFIVHCAWLLWNPYCCIILVQ